MFQIMKYAVEKKYNSTPMFMSVLIGRGGVYRYQTNQTRVYEKVSVFHLYTCKQEVFISLERVLQICHMVSHDVVIAEI